MTGQFFTLYLIGFSDVMEFLVYSLKCSYIAISKYNSYLYWFHCMIHIIYEICSILRQLTQELFTSIALVVNVLTFSLIRVFTLSVVPNMQKILTPCNVLQMVNKYQNSSSTLIFAMYPKIQVKPIKKNSLINTVSFLYFLFVTALVSLHVLFIFVMLMVNKTKFTERSTARGTAKKYIKTVPEFNQHMS